MTTERQGNHSLNPAIIKYLRECGTWLLTLTPTLLYFINILVFNPQLIYTYSTHSQLGVYQRTRYQSSSYTWNR